MPESSVRDVIPPTRLSPRRAQTRERLLAAAITSFAERGVHGASVEEISEAAGFTRGAFYSNFADKNELVLELIRWLTEAQFAAAEHAVSSLQSALERRAAVEELVGIALAAFDAVGVHGTEATLAGQELLLYAAREPSVRGAYRAYAQECRRQFADLIGNGLTAAGLEFSIDFATAIELMEALHDKVELNELFSGDRDFTMLSTLLIAITRPRAPLG